MSNCKPADFPWISAYLAVKNVEQSIEFYEAAFGFKMREAISGDGDNQTHDKPAGAAEDQLTHAEIRYQDSLFMIGAEGAWGQECRSPVTSGTTSPVNLYVYVEDVDKHCLRAEECGAKIIEQPQDTFWGDRMYKAQDPNGYDWCFATKK